jgi:hypothetical protein
MRGQQPVTPCKPRLSWRTSPSGIGSDPSSIDEKRGPEPVCRLRSGCGWQARDRETLPSRTAKNEDGRPASRLLGLQANKPICSNTRTQVQFPERPGQAVFDEIVCCGGVAGERPRVASRTRNFGFDVPKRAGHRELLPLVTIGLRPIRVSERLPPRCYPMMSARPVLCKNL